MHTSRFRTAVLVVSIVKYLVVALTALTTAHAQYPKQTTGELYLMIARLYTVRSSWEANYSSESVQLFQIPIRDPFSQEV